MSSDLRARLEEMQREELEGHTGCPHADEYVNICPECFTALLQIIATERAAREAAEEDARQWQNKLRTQSKAVVYEYKRAEAAERERDLFQKKARDFNVEADRYLAMRDELTVTVEALESRLSAAEKVLRRIADALYYDNAKQQYVITDVEWFSHDYTFEGPRQLIEAALTSVSPTKESQ